MMLQDSTSMSKAHAPHFLMSLDACKLCLGLSHKIKALRTIHISRMPLMMTIDVVSVSDIAIPRMNACGQTPSMVSPNAQSSFA